MTATTGTITGVFSAYGTWDITITGVTSGSNSPIFTGRGFAFGSYTVAGTFGGTSAQLVGSNDQTTWVNVGAALTSAGGGPNPASQADWKYYQWQLTGGDATTSLNMNVTFEGAF